MMHAFLLLKDFEAAHSQAVLDACASRIAELGTWRHKVWPWMLKAALPAALQEPCSVPCPDDVGVQSPQQGCIGATGLTGPCWGDFVQGLALQRQHRKRHLLPVEVQGVTVIHMLQNADLLGCAGIFGTVAVGAKHAVVMETIFAQMLRLPTCQSRLVAYGQLLVRVCAT